MATSQRYLEDFSVGDRFVTAEATLSREECIAFARAYDPQPFHLDDEAAARSIFKRLSASAWLTLGVAMRLVVQSGFLKETGILGVAMDEMRFLAPVYPGDSLHVESEILELTQPASGKRFGRMRIRQRVMNQDGVCVVSYIPNVSVELRPEGSSVV